MTTPKCDCGAALRPDGVHRETCPVATQRGGDLSTKFGGRTVRIEVYVNTDETTEDVVERVRRAAAGPAKRLVFCGGSLHEGTPGRKFWDGILPVLRAEVGQGRE